MSKEALPLGGVNIKKYAAICHAVGMARGALHGVLHGDLDGVGDIWDLTSLSAIAKALGHNEHELAIIWDEHLSPAEMSR